MYLIAPTVTSIIINWKALWMKPEYSQKLL